ncbi:calcium proton exchanger [Suillus ampliporus]|nr:calcium proton exchanger [Suillus ampliporus]
MSTTETTPLLENGGHVGYTNLYFTRRVLGFLKGDGEPSWAESFKFFIFGTWFNVLLVFIPLSFISHYLDLDAGLRFCSAFWPSCPWLRLGETMAGLLNASFGNAVEIIVGVAALLNGQLLIVQASMLGSILSDILLVLGCSFLAGGLYHSEGIFNPAGAKAYLMTLSCITLVIPAAYANHCDEQGGCPIYGVLFISRGISILLLEVYFVYLWFQLKSHAQFFYIAPTTDPNEKTSEETEPRMGTAAACFALLSVAVITAFCAEYLVAFIGVILLPIVSNATEHATSVWMAMKNKYELIIAICVGSSIIIVLFVSVLLVHLLIMDGKTNYMEGLMLLTLYVVIALAFWVAD